MSPGQTATIYAVAVVTAVAGPLGFAAVLAALPFLLLWRPRAA